ncbi:MAG TPA: ABC transporter ATP-binding protein [Terriglobales bacterium]|nr:ABC transporter ATP-binding protein [Terriglobales bacterium]
MADEEEITGKAVDGKLIRRLLGYVRPYRWTVVFATIAAALQSATQIVGPYLNKVIIDRYLLPSGAAQSWLGNYLPADAMRGVATIGLIYLMVLTVGFALDFAQTYAMQWVGQHSMYDLRRQIFAHLQRLPVSFFDRNPAGRLVTRVTNDVELLNDTISTALVALFDDIFVLTMIIVVMIRFNWQLSLITLGVLPAIFIATQYFRKAVRESYRRIRLLVARLNVFLQEHITGISVVQAFNREQRAYQEFERINKEHCDAWVDAVFAYSVYYPVVEFLSIFAVTLILWFGGLRVMHGHLTIGIVFAFIQYAQRFFRPIQDLSDKYNTLQASMASSERIFKLLDAPLGGDQTPAAAPLPVLPAAGADGGPTGRIEFEHVWFAYIGEDWILRDLSFVVEPGQSLAIVGHTGAGKTTMTSLLLRFYDVQKGRILLDGVDIKLWDVHRLRQRFGIVLQDPYLFSGTIADNIRMGDTNLSEERLQAAERDANLGDFLATLPDGDRTVLRERGNGLSTGQKQLVNFARALAANPSILILDEATASVDTDTEIKIRSALDHMLAGRTSVLIAHRLSTIQRANLILVLHKGILREQGTHQQLLHQRGIYWRLYRLQYKDQEVDRDGVSHQSPYAEPLIIEP